MAGCGQILIRMDLVDTDGINSLRNGPDEHGRFGLYGGRFVAETLMPLILDLEAQYRAAKVDPAFKAQIVESYRRIVALKAKIGS